MPQKIPRRIFLALTGGALAAPKFSFGAAEVPTVLDHILLGCSDLDEGVAFVEHGTGVRAAFGGVHPGRGTRNALLSLGERHYLEIITSDPAQSGVPDRFGLKNLSAPRIVGWAAHPGKLDDFAKRLQQAKLAFDGPASGSRKRPDGKLLQWKTLNLHDDFDGLLPFFIEWSADTMHPAIDAPPGCHLESFELLASDPEALTKIANQLGLGVGISKAATSQTRAVIRCAAKELRLTS